MKKVLVYGSVNIDIVYSVSHIVLPGETISSSDIERNAGGKGANQSAALAKAGLETFLAGKIGADGAWILELLNSYGVDTSLVTVSDGMTGNAIIQRASDGQNSIVLFAGTNREIEEAEIDSVLDHFSSGDILVLQNEISGLDRIIRAAREKGMYICLNPAPFDESVFSLPLHLVDLIVVNELEGAALASLPASSGYTEIMDRLTALYPEKDILLTCGSHGAYYCSGDARGYSPIVESKVVDTTAAGDTFIGYFLAAMLDGMPVSRSLDIASKASSITVSRMGAMDSVPVRGEVF